MQLFSSSSSASSSSSSPPPTVSPPPPPWQLFANFHAHWAPPDLNLGPSDPSQHRWTSTWDLATSARSAGPQPATFRAPFAPLDLYSQIQCQKICQIGRKKRKSDRIPEEIPDKMLHKMREEMPDTMPKEMPDRMPEGMPDKMSKYMPEDLPVTKRINVMAGMTRSKVILFSPRYPHRLTLHALERSGQTCCTLAFISYMSHAHLQLLPI